MRLQQTGSSAPVFTGTNTQPAQSAAADAYLAECMKAVVLAPTTPHLHFKLAAHYFAVGNKFSAKASCEKAIALCRTYAEAWTLLGRIADSLNDTALAVKAYATAASLTPLYAEPRQALAALCDKRKVPAPHLAAWPALSASAPTDWALVDSEDEATLRGMLAIDSATPNLDAKVLVKLALMLMFYERAREAGCFIDYVLAHQPQNISALIAKSTLMETAGDEDAVAKIIFQAFKIAPSNPMVATQAMTTVLKHAAWDKYDTILQEVLNTPPSASEPSASLFYVSDPALQANIAAAWASRFIPLGRDKPVRAAQTRAPKTKLTIGYISADFAPHPIGRLLGALLPHHNRDQFIIRAYSIWPGDDGNDVQRRIKDTCASFTELYGAPSLAAAQKIADDGVDILLDMTGYTMNCRPDILAHQAAPIQVNYAGYLGTMGAPFIQYQISDAVVAAAPKTLCAHEALVRLPHSLLAGDRHGFVKNTTPVSRAGVGLPESATVFCNFSKPNRFTPAMFDVWMRILKRVPGSVLWLSRPPAKTAQRLQTEAFTRDIDPRRIIFCDALDYDTYLQRIALADLFLDTLPHNAGAVAMDTLWMGCPLLTCPGDVFQSRIGAGMVRAAGIPELAVSSIGEYEETAVRLGTSPTALHELKGRLRSARDTHPMFDTGLMVRHLEWAYQSMWQRYQNGLPPGLIDVPAMV